MRLLLAALAGLSVAAVCAVVLGDYPLSGSVPWVSAVVVPILVGLASSAAAGGHRLLIWAATGPVAAGSIAWGVRIATGWGLDPIPASCWAAICTALVWPPAWAALSRRRRHLGSATSRLSPSADPVAIPAQTAAPHGPT